MHVYFCSNQKILRQIEILCFEMTQAKPPKRVICSFSAFSETWPQAFHPPAEGKGQFLEHLDNFHPCRKSKDRSLSIIYTF